MRLREIEQRMGFGGNETSHGACPYEGRPRGSGAGRGLAWNGPCQVRDGGGRGKQWVPADNRYLRW